MPSEPVADTVPSASLSGYPRPCTSCTFAPALSQSPLRGCAIASVCRFEELRAERIAKYQGMNLYVKNLHDDIDDDALRTEFSQVGCHGCAARLV